MTQEHLPCLFVFSDARGATATSVVNAAVSQFDENIVEIKRLPDIDSVEKVRRYLDSELVEGVEAAVFHTIANPDLRRGMRTELDRRNIPSIDLLGPAVSVIETLTGAEPKNIAGSRVNPTSLYYRREKAMEYLSRHDSGSDPHDLDEADIVLIGVSRTQKTPLCMYLSFYGYKAANITLSPSRPVPEMLFELDPKRVVGLKPDTKRLSELRQRRLKDAAAFSLAGSYSDPQLIEKEQQFAESIMKQVGCPILSIAGRAVDDLGIELIEYLERLDGDAPSLD